jgi:hypothetical protein
MSTKQKLLLAMGSAMLAAIAITGALATSHAGTPGVACTKADCTKADCTKECPKECPKECQPCTGCPGR